jgi:hypothetical protein
MRHIVDAEQKICLSRERWHGYSSVATRELYEALQIQELENLIATP